MSSRRCEGGDPQDDRVWLGRANLATWLGQFDEAGRWLDACETRSGPTTRRSGRLAWNSPGRRRMSRGSGVPWTICRRAGSSRSRSSGSGAGWPRGPAMTRSSGETLQALVDEEPGRYRGLGPAGRAGPEGRAARRGRRVPQEEGRDETSCASGTRRSPSATTATQHAGELGRLAESLGRRIEARGWSLIRRGRAVAGSSLPGAGGPDARRRRRPDGRLAGGRSPPPRDDATPRDRPTGRATAGAGAGGLRRPGRVRRAPVLPRQRPHPQESPADRGDVRGRRAARLRRRRLARRLCRPGRVLSRRPGLAASARRRPPLPQPGRRPLRGRDPARGDRRLPRRLRPRRGRRRLRQRRPARPVRHPMAIVCPLPQPGRRDVRGRHDRGRAWAATATGRPRRPSPTSTATAISTSTSAITSGTTRQPQALRAPRLAERPRVQPARFPVAARPRLPQRRRAGSST